MLKITILNHHLNYSTDDLPNFLIVDRGKHEEIEEGKDGVFAFGTLTSDVGIRPHFLLIDRDSFQILNMREPIDVNVLKLIQFFERNKEQYSKDEILFYMKNLIDIYQGYEAYIKSRGELFLKQEKQDEHESED